MTLSGRYPGGMEPLAAFSPPTRAWFERVFEEPTPAQALGWPAIGRGGHVLIQAPTGSGKTLAAFLTGIDRLNESPGEGLRLLYVSPLKALNYDIERNLRSPLAGLESKLAVGVRTGDTPADERRRMLKTPPDILITTPESLFLLLTSQARETLRGVETVILDEVHAVAGSKRGSHLALSLERLEDLRRANRCSASVCQRRSVRSPRSAASSPAPTARSSSSTRDRARSSTSRSSSRSRTCASSPRRPTSPCLRSPTACRWAPVSSSRAARSGPRSTPRSSSSCGNTVRRSCSSTTAGSPSGSRSG